MMLPIFLSLASLHAPARAAEVPTTVSTSPVPSPALDLRIGGLPLEGQRLSLEVHGPASTSFLVRVDFVSATPGARDASAAALFPTAFEGSRAASFLSRLLAGQGHGRLLLPGRTDATGAWRKALEAPVAGTRILARGYALRDGAIDEFEALELDVLPLSPSSLPLQGATVGHSTSSRIGIPPQPCDPAFADSPDLGFQDSNCDGIDGDIERAVFVATTGLPSNPGTMDAPIDDIMAAIAIADAHPFKDQVYVSEGTYPGLITLTDGVSIWGGYSAAHGWERSNAYVTTISVGGVYMGNQVGLRAANLASPMTLGSVTITTADAPALGNNYGILIQNSPSFALEGVTVVAGAGGTASSGTAGGNGLNGTSGSTASGQNGGSPGYTYYDGGWGGDGGNVLGGGWDGQDGEFGGSGGSGGGLSSNGTSGISGSSGTNGFAGQGGSNDGYIPNGLWVSFGNGSSGGFGNNGGAGGGGGGGGGGVFGQGGGGGGGGGGGQGGGGGGGGSFGGSSFAVFLANSTASIQSCQLTAGNGRAGGNGGNAGLRGIGGSRGFGASTNVSTGGNGGNGGNGGYGAGGGGGCGGNSYAILADPLSAVSSLQATTLSTSTPGAGGTGGAGGTSSNNGLNGHAGEAVSFRTL